MDEELVDLNNSMSQLLENDVEDNDQSEQSNTENDASRQREEEFKKECLSKPILDGTYFTVDFRSSNWNKINAKCNTCEKIYRLSSFASISNFVTHLKIKHKDVYVKFLSYKLEKAKKSRASTMSIQQKFEKNITNYILCTTVPFSTVENPHFRKIINDIPVQGKPIKHISRKTLAKRINENFKENMSNIVSKLQKVKYVCTTADIWSARTRSFLGVTAHWLNPNDLTRHSAALACRRFEGPHTYDRIAQLLSDIHSSFELNNNKIVSTVTDNASNMKKAFKEHGIDTFETENKSNDLSDKSSDEGSDDEECHIVEDAPIRLPNHTRCASHTLNLVVTTDAKRIIQSADMLKDRHNQAVNRLQQLWLKQSHPNQCEIIRKYLGCLMVRPVVVRWNSFYDSIESVLELKENILNTNFYNEIKTKDKLQEQDFKYFQKYMLVMKPLAETIDLLQGDKTCDYAFLLPSILHLRKQWLKIMNDENELAYVKLLAKNLLDAVDVRFGYLYDIEGTGRKAVIATTIHPRFKTKWISSLPNYESDTVSIVRKILIDAGVEIGLVNLQEPENFKDDQFEFDSFDDDEDNNVSQSINKTLIETAILNYLCKGRSFDVNVIKNENTIIEELYLLYNTTLPSSAPVERLFSYSTMVNLPRYNRLNDKNFEKRVLSIANSVNH